MNKTQPSERYLTYKRKTEVMLKTLAAKVHTKHLSRLQEIENEDYTPVIRKARELYKTQFGNEPTEEWIESGIVGLKQYYAVALLDPRNAHEN